MATAFNLSFEKVSEKFGARPFGNLTGEWRELVRHLTAKDELWFFKSPGNPLGKKLGCQGYAIVQDGVILRTLITLRS